MKHRFRGNAMVEFALVSSVLLSAMTGCFQFGYAFYQYAGLETTVRHAARYASMLTYTSPNNTPTDGYKAAVANMLLTGNPNPPVPGVDATPKLGNLDSSSVDVRMTFNDGVPSKVTVALKDYSLNAFFTNLSLDQRPSATLPYVGRWSPPGE